MKVGNPLMALAIHLCMITIARVSRKGWDDAEFHFLFKCNKSSKKGLVEISKVGPRLCGFNLLRGVRTLT
jgi:hypothetical protein